MPTIYATGGFRPPERIRHPASLSLSEREEISRGLAASLSLSEIARKLSRVASIINREVKRHGGLKHYRANKADATAWDNAKRPKKCMLKGSPDLCYVIAQKLKRSWAPQQISGWLKRKYANNQEMQVSHETIYKTLYIQTRGALKKELQKCLRTKRVVRKSRATKFYVGTEIISVPNYLFIATLAYRCLQRIVNHLRLCKVCFYTHLFQKLN